MQAIHGRKLKCFQSSPDSEAKDIPRKAFPKKIGYERSDLVQKLSFTFSYDVVKLIYGLVSSIKSKTKGFKAYNIACEEQMNLKEFVKLTNELLLDQLEIKSKRNITKYTESKGDSDDNSKDCEGFYPSVDCGPISISKATRELKFKPTPLVDAIKESIKFNISVDQSQAYR